MLPHFSSHVNNERFGSDREQETLKVDSPELSIIATKLQLVGGKCGKKLIPGHRSKIISIDDWTNGSRCWPSTRTKNRIQMQKKRKHENSFCGAKWGKKSKNSRKIEQKSESAARSGSTLRHREFTRLQITKIVKITRLLLLRSFKKKFYDRIWVRLKNLKTWKWFACTNGSPKMRQQQVHSPAGMKFCEGRQDERSTPWMRDVV